jgi:hypothetical protein
MKANLAHDLFSKDIFILKLLAETCRIREFKGVKGQCLQEFLLCTLLHGLSC